MGDVVTVDDEEYCSGLEIVYWIWMYGALMKLG